MGGFKAPGPDGFQAIFFQNQWQVVGKTFCEMVQKIFEEPDRIVEVNGTLITLIPKKDMVTCMRDFRPISLCNVSYKTVTKIIAQKLRGLMSNLVGRQQSSFVPNSQSGDNIIVAQEVFHSMRKKTGSTGWMAIKVDLEKTYDRLKWEFIIETLEDIGLPVILIDLIWLCISTLSMHMLWNGEALDEFSPMRGIRQGDPLSPYLFVLCIEKLFQMVSLAVDNKAWKPISLSRNGPKLSHLAFVDDLIFFAESNLEQIHIIQSILDLFYRSSGQKVSKENSRVFFSKNVGWHTMQNLSSAIGIQWTEDLGKYLGVPILHKRVSWRYV